MASAERVTVTLPSALLDEIDRVERNRSRFISEAVSHELARRRRAALLHSIRNPHAESSGPVETDLSDWNELGTGDDLIESDGGTPVRWIEGRGWIQEPE